MQQLSIIHQMQKHVWNLMQIASTYLTLEHSIKMEQLILHGLFILASLLRMRKHAILLSSKAILHWILLNFLMEQLDGLDYRHGTGHGIGSFLNVHEGPHQISFRPTALNVALQPSMTVTDEPGYYEDGSFGIRLENVLIVKEADTKYNFGDKGYLSFEHITWAPYQKKLMDLSLLTTEEVQWVNAYHSTCRKVLAPYMDEHEMAWLSRATEPIST